MHHMDKTKQLIAKAYEARAKKAARLKAKGFSLREIGKKLGVSHETVRNDLKSINVELTGSGRPYCPESSEQSERG